MVKNIIYLFILGVLFGSGPCVAGCGPALVSYVTGAQRNFSGNLLFYTLFTVGRTFIYFIFIAVIFIFGKPVFEKLSESTIKYLLSAAGIFFISAGALFIVRKTRSKAACASKLAQAAHSDLLPAACLGLIFGALPCAPLLSVLSYIFLLAQNLIQAVIYCFSFSMGTFFSALLLMVVGAGIFNQLFSKKPQLYRKIIGIISGGIFIGIGINFILQALRS
ncbi:MAG: sulfite exporter TauE/SafE family protein [Candidatus Omnitrophota bacterium]